MSLLRAHKSVFKLVQDTLSSNDALSHIRCSVGSRFQAEQNPEVIIQQSSFDINDLNTADYESFEISIFCYSNTYTEAANLADTLFLAIQASPLYALTETETLGGQTTVTVTNYHLKPLDLYLEHYDEDGYEANVLIRVTESESSSSTGTGGTPPPLGTPVVYYPSSESRIQDLADVNVTSLAEGQILKYDFSENEWVNASLPLLASNGIVSSEVNGVTLLSLSNSLSVGSLASSSDVTVGGDLYFAGSQTKLIRPLDAGVTAGPLTIQSNGDLIVELDENQSNDDPNLNNSFVVKNGANDEVFKITEEGVLTINNQYSLPDADGSANYFLKTDGSGQLYFATQYGTSGNTAGSPPPVIDTIDELLDTQLSALADNQILRYDSSTSKWVNEDLTLAQSIGDLTDVDTTTVAPANGQALVWNNANSEWEPGTIEGGVTSIVAGSGVSLSPSGGTGDVTVSVPSTIEYMSLKMGSDVLQGGASQQNFTSATPVKTIFNTADDSEGSGLTADTTNNRITVSNNGLYRLTANITFYSTQQRITPTTFFRVNGTTDLIGESYGYIRSASGQHENSNNVTRVVRLSANDYVEVFHFDASSATGTIYATQALFEVELISGGAVGPTGPTGLQGPSGTSYDVVTITADTTLSSSHTTKYLVCNSATAIDLTVPASAAYDTYAEFVIEQRGAGLVRLVAANGVTINSTETLQSSGQYSVMGLKRTDTNVYTLTGEREATP